MVYSVLITPTAIRDIQFAIDYYNDKSENLGYRFEDLINEYFQRIAIIPTASEERYNKIRCKPVLDEVNSTVTILRIFNTYQEPLW